jgi:putative holliday junction resolvase
MPFPATGRLLGIDWGEVRIGLALSDETQTLATPLDTLTRRAWKRVPMARLLELIRTHHPVGAVVGLPLDASGQESAASRSARELALLVQDRGGLPVVLWDERMSTARALGAIAEQGGNIRGRREEVDALAAAVLLQHYLHARREGGA